MTKSKTRSDVPLRKLTDFIEAFAKHFSEADQLICYRGQRDSAWGNVAGIFRPEFRKLLKEEKWAIRELMSVQTHEFAADETMFDKLVRMQHFGLPTRLLDVSRNALVALFFATDSGPEQSKTDGKVTAFAIPRDLEKYYDSDSVSCISNLANLTADEKVDISRLRDLLGGELSDSRNIRKFNQANIIERLLQFIRSEKPYFQPIMNPIDLFVPYYVHPKMSNRRILAQSGAFILSSGILPHKTMFFPYKIEETPFIVPQAEKGSIRRALDNIGINESTLFPEIDKAANRIRARYTDI